MVVVMVKAQAVEVRGLGWQLIGFFCFVLFFNFCRKVSLQTSPVF